MYTSMDGKWYASPFCRSAQIGGIFAGVRGEGKAIGIANFREAAPRDDKARPG
jgi:hypothetical protein